MKNYFQIIISTKKFNEIKQAKKGPLAMHKSKNVHKKLVLVSLERINLMRFLSCIFIHEIFLACSFYVSEENFLHLLFYNKKMLRC